MEKPLGRRDDRSFVRMRFVCLGDEWGFRTNEGSWVFVFVLHLSFSLLSFVYPDGVFSTRAADFLFVTLFEI